MGYATRGFDSHSPQRQIDDRCKRRKELTGNLMPFQVRICSYGLRRPAQRRRPFPCWFVASFAGAHARHVEMLAPW